MPVLIVSPEWGDGLFGDDNETDLTFQCDWCGLGLKAFIDVCRESDLNFLYGQSRVRQPKTHFCRTQKSKSGAKCKCNQGICVVCGKRNRQRFLGKCKECFVSSDIAQKYLRRASWDPFRDDWLYGQQWSRREEFWPLHRA